MDKEDLRILVVDDDPSVRSQCVKLLRKKGYPVDGVDNGDMALSMVDNGDFDLVIADIRIPGLDGISLLQWIKETKPDTECVMITGYGTIESAVRSIRLGAYDYITKPFDKEKFLKVIENVATKLSLSNEVRILRERLKDLSDPFNMIGISEEMQNIFRLVEKFSPIDCNVLIQGESGTGKGLIARAIHVNSPRNNNPFIVVDCAALSETLLESELFGHKKGAFTGANADKKGFFATADRGTILLDEISELPLTLQGKLLRMVQEHETVPLGSTHPIKVDTRVLAATNQDLELLVKQGRFREDLFFRLNVVRIDIPPLRERPDDIVPLCTFFLDRFKKRFEKTDLAFDAEGLAQLKQYEWPGNIRELENLILQLVIMSDGHLIRARDLPEKMRNSRPVKEFYDYALSELDFATAKKRFLDSFLRKFLIDALGRHQGNISKTSETINVRRASLQRMIKRYQIRREEFR